MEIFTLPSPNLISSNTVLVIISVFCNLSIPLFICFNTLIFANASFISLYNSAFSQCSLFKPSTHLGKVIFNVSIGNSYNILPKILLISSKFKREQSVGNTGVSYFFSNF